MDEFTQLCQPKSLEEWRASAHRYFDRLWRFNPDPGARSRAYSALRELFGREIHISDMSVAECQQTIAFAKKRNRGGKRVRRVPSHSA